MIIEIIRALVGFALALFIPGYILVMIFFKELKQLEKIVFAIIFSIMIDITIAIYFGYDQAQAARTGGLTFENIIRAELILFIILVAILWIKILLMKKTKMFIKKEPARKNEKKPIKFY